MKENTYKTVNTFSRKPCINQILSYVLIVAENISFWGFVQPNLVNEIARAILISLFILTLLILVISTCMTSYTDPSDSTMVNFRSKTHQKKTSDNQISYLFCSYCDSYVSRQSKHCKLCDRYCIHQRRCVEEFDHHCIWINNCIGKNNYRSFLVMINSTFLNMMAYVIAVTFLWHQNNWKTFFHLMVINWIMSLIILIFSILILLLIMLHFYLLKMGLTTFGYIYQKRKTQNTKIHVEIEKKQTFFKTQYINQGDNQKKEKIIQSQKVNTQEQFTGSENFIKTSLSKIPRLNQHEFYISGQSIKHQMGENQQKFAKDQMQNLEDFYRKHRSLKMLVGKSIIVRPKEPKQKILHDYPLDRRKSILEEEKTEQKEEKKKRRKEEHIKSSISNEFQ